MKEIELLSAHAGCVRSLEMYLRLVADVEALLRRVTEGVCIWPSPARGPRDHKVTDAKQAANEVDRAHKFNGGLSFGLYMGSCAGNIISCCAFECIGIIHKKTKSNLESNTHVNIQRMG